MIKVQVENLIKKVNLGSLITFQNLTTGVKGVFKSLPTQLSFYYIDQDDDKIGVNNTSDLEVFLKSEKRLKLYVESETNIISQNIFSQSLCQVSEKIFLQSQKEQSKPLEMIFTSSTSPKKEKEQNIQKQYPLISQKQQQEKQIFEKPFSTFVKGNSTNSKQVDIKDTNELPKQTFQSIPNSQYINQTNYISSIYQLFNPKCSQKQYFELMKYQISEKDIEQNSFAAVTTIWQSSRTLSEQIADQFQDWQSKYNIKI